MSAYESPIHELSYAVLLVSKLQVFSEIWQDDYRSVGNLSPGTVPPLVPSVDLRGAITQRPERQFTSGLVCAKALFLVFHGHQSACELSLWPLSYSRSTVPRLEPTPKVHRGFPQGSPHPNCFRLLPSQATPGPPLPNRPLQKAWYYYPRFRVGSCICLASSFSRCCG